MSIKPEIIAAIRKHADHGTPCGHFVTAVLCNDLKEAIGRADQENLRDLIEIVSYCYNEIPSTCWGSPDAVATWIRDKQNQRDISKGIKGFLEKIS